MKTSSTTTPRLAFRGGSAGPYRPILRYSKDHVPIHRLVFPVHRRLNRSRSYCRYDETDASRQPLRIARTPFPTITEDEESEEGDCEVVANSGSRRNEKSFHSQQKEPSVYSSHASSSSSSEQGGTAGGSSVSASPSSTSQPGEPAASSAPTTPASASAPRISPSDVKQRRRKVRGLDYWFTFCSTRGPMPLSNPPAFPAQPGWTHTHNVEGHSPQVWVLSVTGEWLEGKDGFQHPDLQAYQLTIQPNGQPRWKTLSSGS